MTDMLFLATLASSASVLVSKKRDASSQSIRLQIMLGKKYSTGRDRGVVCNVPFYPEHKCF